METKNILIDNKNMKIITKIPENEIDYLFDNINMEDTLKNTEDNYE